jgi:hypothetical protein
MLKRDKNGFIDIITSNGFDPSQFKRYEKDDVDNHPGFIVQLVNSPLFFLARTNSEDFHKHDSRFVKFGPNFSKSEYFPEKLWCQIEDIYEHFEYWLKKHVRIYIEEIDIPDLWEQLEGNYQFDADPLRGRSTESFTKPEKEKIRASLNHFRNLIEVEYSPSQDQLEAINDRLNYLSESLDRLNKVDWQGIAISSVISISIALSLDTEQGKNLFYLFKQAFTAALELLK